ncbi:hypothetical protein K8I85_16820 [bacterium]|nr:hypothetical protein [bacterium]
MDSILNAEAWRQVLSDSLGQLLAQAAGILPGLVAAAFIVAIGWIVSKLVERVVARLFERVGLDRASDRLRVTDVLRQAGVKRSASRLLGGLLFWILMLTFVLSAVDTLGLTTVASTIDRLIEFLPNVLAAALILIAGLLAGRFVEHVVRSGASVANEPQARALGVGARAIVVVVVISLALETLGIRTTLLVTLACVLVAALALTMGMAFALGAKPVMTHILAGHFLRQSLAAGLAVEVNGRKGVVERVGVVETLLHEGAQAWSIPNAVLLEETVLR